MNRENTIIVIAVIALLIVAGIVIAVNYDDDTYVPVTIGKDGEGTVDPAVGSHSFIEGTSITVTATPSEGYAVYGITVNGEYVTVTDNKVDVRIDKETEIHVYFVTYANVSAQDPNGTLKVPGPYGNPTTLSASITGLTKADMLMATNTTVDNYGPKASMFDITLKNGSLFESADITLSIPGDVSKGTVIHLGDGSQPTGISMAYDSASDMSTVRFTTSHLSQFLIYDGHVSTAQGLRNIARIVNTGTADIGNVILDRDIDLQNQEWTPIGKDSPESVNKPYAFNGTFDGKGYRIMNISITTGNDQVGFFGAIENGTVTNLTLMNVDISGGDKVGAVAGETFFGTVLNNVHVKNAEIMGNHFVGGIVGYMQGTVSNCSVIGTSDSPSTIKAIPAMSGTVYDDGDKVGGIVGYVQNHQTDLAYSVSGCEVGYVDITAYRDVGGLIGCIVEQSQDYAVSVNGNILYDVDVICDQMTNPYGFVTPNADKLIGREAGQYTERNNMMSQTRVSVSVSVDTDADLLTVLTDGSDDIAVTLGSDRSVNVSDSSLRFGGRNTSTLTINGTGKLLTLSTTYISQVGMTNPGGTLVLNDLRMTSTQTSGTWDSYDILFLSNVVMTSVSFDKAIALDNAGRTSELKDITITEDNDYYAMWIVAGADVDIDGMTIQSQGRGIKISDQYVNGPGLTELDISDSEFTTSKKSAVIVGSAGGADIDWKDGNDISKVSADTKNAVWVDIDYVAYAGKVTVEGCTKVIEPSS